MEAQRVRLLGKLSPSSVRTTLLKAGTFLVVYELIKYEVVEKLHDFLVPDRGAADDAGREQHYQLEVVSKAPTSRYRASCLWLVESGALDLRQVAALEAVYEQRKMIAHELPKLVVDPDFEVRMDLLNDAVNCLRALGQFWGSIELDSHPAFDDREIDTAQIKSGAYVVAQYLMELLENEGSGSTVDGPRSPE
jgi:hypothetical protein